jgi:ubiquinol-cytochrome c reductase cytochrome b subunit
LPRSDALTRFADWFDDRTSYRAIRSALWNRRVPGGPRWSHATGACTLGLFAVVFATGLLLMTGYSPASDHGWSSVFLIQSTPSGAFLRGLHYFGSHALIILFAIHLAREILSATFRAPRELAWLSGLLLLPLLVAEAITGNPLPASNKAVGQIEVESRIVGDMPGVGPIVRMVLVGGEEVGNLTMTRLYALHVAILPMLAGLLLALHAYQLVRWGTIATAAGTTAVPDEHLAPADRATDGASYWPNQTARNAIAFGLVFGLVAFLAWRYGAPLDAPVDPTLEEMPRPEWYSRPLFELRAYVSGSAEFLATGILPILLLAFLAALPWIDRLLPRRASVIFRYAVVILGAGGWAGLTAASFGHDRRDGDYREFRARAVNRAERAKFLATVRGIPPEGPSSLLRSDPLTQGPVLFERHCKTCHPHRDARGNGIAARHAAAANLSGFASRDWIAGLLDPKKITGSDYFGHTAFVTEGTSNGMIDFVRDELYALEGEELQARKEQIRKAVLALSAEAALPGQAAADRKDAKAIAEGRELLAGDELGCVNCHKFHDAGELGGGPDLTGYGSRDWLAAFIANPAHERFYAESNDGMPAFLPGEPDSPQNILTRAELLLITDWLRGDWPR